MVLCWLPLPCTHIWACIHSPHKHRVQIKQNTGTSILLTVSSNCSSFLKCEEGIHASNRRGHASSFLIAFMEVPTLGPKWRLHPTQITWRKGAGTKDIFFLKKNKQTLSPLHILIIPAQVAAIGISLCSSCRVVTGRTYPAADLGLHFTWRPPEPAHPVESFRPH